MAGCFERALLAGLIASATFTGCEAAPSQFGPGLDLQVRVAGAQLQQGPLGPDEGGPTVSQVLRPQSTVHRGEAAVELDGRLGAGGVALHVQAVGDEDHWIAAPKGFDFVIADELLWDAQLEFSHAIIRDRVTLRLQATDASGRGGPVREVDFGVLPDVPPSALLVSLGWDGPVDLDLHVELPDGTVVGAKNTSSYEPPAGGPIDPDAWMLGAYHDFDSNQQCRLDLRNRENVVWPMPPTPGIYRVYAQLFSPCDRAAVNFQAMVQRADDVTDVVGGTLHAFDSREHPADGEAPGLLVLEFEVE